MLLLSSWENLENLQLCLFIVASSFNEPLKNVQSKAPSCAWKMLSFLRDDDAEDWLVKMKLSYYRILLWQLSRITTCLRSSNDVINADWLWHLTKSWESGGHHHLCQKKQRPKAEQFYPVSSDYYYYGCQASNNDWSLTQDQGKVSSSSSVLPISASKAALHFTVMISRPHADFVFILQFILKSHWISPKLEVKRPACQNRSIVWIFWGLNSK